MSAPSTRKLALAAVGVTAVTVAGLSVFVVLARQPKPQTADTVSVVVTDSACRPDHLTVPAGNVVFSIRNEGTRAQEWEIIQGLMVIEERENIAPGLSQKMTVRLEPGDYEITCGSQSKFEVELRGKLTVIPAVGGSQPQTVKPKTIELVEALAEYRFFLLEETDALKEDTQALAIAIKAGQMDLARSLYPRAHAHYERIRPIAALFSDLDAAINSRADEHGQKEADPTFTGFHRLEYGLFTQKGGQNLGDLADRLNLDAVSLEERVKSLSLTPEKMADGAALLLESVRAGKISGKEERYSRTDLWDFKANMEGAEKIIELLRPMLIKTDKAQQDKIDAKLAKIDAVLSRYVQPDGSYPSYDRLTDNDRNSLTEPVETLSEDLSKIRDVLGLN